MVRKNGKMKKTTILLILFALLATDAFGQRIVSGIVFDELNEPLIAATIREVGTGFGTITNFDGEFTITTLRDSTELQIEFIGYQPQRMEIISDTILMITLEPEIVFISGFFVYGRQIGVNYDVANGMFGVGFDSEFNHFIRQRIRREGRHFVFRPEYKMSVHTDFRSSYGFNANFRLLHPIRGLRLGEFSLRYAKKNYSGNNDLQFRKIGIVGSTFLWHPIRIQLFIEPSFQSLNGSDNFGVTVGSQQTFRNWRKRYRVSAGYFGDYWTYSVQVQHDFFAFRRQRFSFQVSYEKIDRFNFFTIGVARSFSRRYTL